MHYDFSAQGRTGNLVVVDTFKMSCHEGSPGRIVHCLQDIGNVQGWNQDVSQCRRWQRENYAFIRFYYRNKANACWPEGFKWKIFAWREKAEAYSKQGCLSGKREENCKITYNEKSYRNIHYINDYFTQHHGTTENSTDSRFAHLAFEIPGENTSNEWLEPVSDEKYNKLK